MKPISILNKLQVNYELFCEMRPKSKRFYYSCISSREFVPGPSFVPLACVDMKVEQQQKQRKIKAGLGLCRWAHSKWEDGFELSHTFGPHPTMFHLVSVMGEA